MDTGELFSIGHSTHGREYFLSLLRMHHVEYLLDVRSTPYSRYAPAYNKDQIQRFLELYGIQYWHMGHFFGARQENEQLYTLETEKGLCLNFEQFRKTDLFKTGVDNVMKGLNNGRNIALMCTEKNPIDCHRAIMVSKGFLDQGINVKHILPDGNIITQKDLEKELLYRYFPETKESGNDNSYRQLELSDFFDFSECDKQEKQSSEKNDEESGDIKPVSEAQKIEECYRLRNKEIGYVLNASRKNT